jgi:hypothetical protein
LEGYKSCCKEIAVLREIDLSRCWCSSKSKSGVTVARGARLADSGVSLDTPLIASCNLGLPCSVKTYVYYAIILNQIKAIEHKTQGI